MSKVIRIAPTANEISINGDTITTDFSGGISYTAEGLSEFDHDYLKQAFSCAIALSSKRWQIEERLNGLLQLNGKVE